MKFKKIALIGMMGSGKTTISKLLANKLNIEAVDLDYVFEKENKIKIKDFFKEYGEEAFRKKENEILTTCLLKENIIISTGGGIILKEENRKLLFNNEVYTVYLKAKPDTIFNRIKNDKTRPLLLVDNPKKEIEKILLSREQFYKKANLTVHTDNKTIQKITDEICKELQ